jgi:hypothetical protein
MNAAAHALTCAHAEAVMHAACLHCGVRALPEEPAFTRKGSYLHCLGCGTTGAISWDTAITRFFLGSPDPSWLWRYPYSLFVSHRRLAGRRQLQPSQAPWALDSGGFSELRRHGRWTISPASYVAAIHRYHAEIGRLVWAAQQDWMCEPTIRRRTGLTVAEHQRRTIHNYLTLRNLAPDLPIVPVLQGWAPADYLRHLDAFDAAGIDLTREPLVGLGSICRRARYGPIAALVAELAGGGVRLHGFGVKLTGLDLFGALLTSADSMAWSYQARRQRIRWPGCAHATCRNCIRQAGLWLCCQVQPRLDPLRPDFHRPVVAARARRRRERGVQLSLLLDAAAEGVADAA